MRNEKLTRQAAVLDRLLGKLLCWNIAREGPQRARDDATREAVRDVDRAQARLTLAAVKEG